MTNRLTGTFTKIAVLISIVLLSGICDAQTKSNLVELTNGEVLRGTITGEVPGQGLTLMIGDTLPRYIPLTEITKLNGKYIVNAEENRKKEIEDREREFTERKKEGLYYEGMVSAGVNIRVAEDNPGSGKISFVNSVNFGGLGSVGIGVGIRYFPTDQVLIAPIYADVRLFFSERSIAPMAGFGGGLAYQQSEGFNEISGGFAFFELGVRIYSPSGTWLQFSVGYEQSEVNGRSSQSVSSGALPPKSNPIQTLSVNLSVIF